MFNWKRGGLRLWIVATILWCAGVTFNSLQNTQVRWPGSPSRTVHVEFGTEIWDYPTDWGVERIAASIKKRLSDVERKERDWAATLPEEKVRECKAIAVTKSWIEMTGDCGRFVSADHKLNVLSGWEQQVKDDRQSVLEAARVLGPIMVGPPLLGLALGSALFWALAGFWRDHGH
jgi:hypothetical protein